MGKPKSDYSIQTVSNALRLLEVFGDDNELGVSELSRRLELHKNNVFRLLATLEQGGYIEQSARTDRYRLGVGCLALGRSYTQSHPLIRRARPVLERLANELGETAHLAVLQGWQVAHLDGEQPSQLVHAAVRIGTALPAHSSALGKVLLGCAPEVLQAFDESLTGTELVALSESTIVDRHKMMEHLRTVTVQGFAVDLEECSPGLHCVAAPIFAEGHRLVAAISVSGPSFRLAEGGLHRSVVPVVTEAAERLSVELGASS